MQPTPRTRPSTVVNRPFPGRLIDQFPTAVVVVNGPPFRGPLITCRAHLPKWPLRLPPAIRRSPDALVGYAVAERAESITRQKRHRSTGARLAFSPLGNSHVLH